MSEEKKMFDLKVFDFGAAAHVPLIEENLLINQRSPWVYYGPANLAPQELIRLYNSSPTHRACVTSKWYAARGEEITLKSGEDFRLQMVNSAGDKMYDLWSKLMLDFILYGGFALNIVWRKDRTKGFEMYYVDFSKLRAEKSDMQNEEHNLKLRCAKLNQIKKELLTQIKNLNEQLASQGMGQGQQIQPIAQAQQQGQVGKKGRISPKQAIESPIKTQHGLAHMGVGAEAQEDVLKNYSDNPQTPEEEEAQDASWQSVNTAISNYMTNQVQKLAQSQQMGR
jgi:hypothetical protein